MPRSNFSSKNREPGKGEKKKKSQFKERKKGGGIPFPFGHSWRKKKSDDEGSVVGPVPKKGGRDPFPRNEKKKEKEPVDSRGKF